MCVDICWQRVRFSWVAIRRRSFLSLPQCSISEMLYLHVAAFIILFTAGRTWHWTCIGTFTVTYDAFSARAASHSFGFDQFIVNNYRTVSKPRVCSRTWFWVALSKNRSIGGFSISSKLDNLSSVIIKKNYFLQPTLIPYINEGLLEWIDLTCAPLYLRSAFSRFVLLYCY